jgi:trehalose-6-phosphate synthase
LKLTAIGQFLAENPHYLGKLVFVIIGITAVERGEDYLQTQKAVLAIVASLNHKFPNSIYYEERKENEMKLVQRVALFYVSDVLMVTAVRSDLSHSFPSLSWPDLPLKRWIEPTPDGIYAHSIDNEESWRIKS